MKKILITGGAGFIGSHLVDYLLEKKTPITNLRLLVPFGESLFNLPDKNFDIVRGDIRNKKIVKKAMDEVEVVYHLAARIDFDGKTYSEYKDVNVQGTKNLLEECKLLARKGKPVKKFVNFSSIGVHGLPAGIGDMLGWDEAHPATYTNFYGRSKWEAEEAVRKAHEDFGLRYATIRPASVYGPREKGPTLALFKAIKNGQFMMIGDGRNKMHYVYVRDLVEATYLASQSKFGSGEYIIGGDKPVEFEMLVGLIYKNLGKKLNYLRINKFVALIIAYVFEALKKLTGTSFPLFPSRVRTMTSSYYFNINKAKKELGYRPKYAIDKGIKLTASWYAEHGLV